MVYGRAATLRVWSRRTFSHSDGDYDGSCDGVYGERAWLLARTGVGSEAPTSGQQQQQQQQPKLTKAKRLLRSASLFNYAAAVVLGKADGENKDTDGGAGTSTERRRRKCKGKGQDKKAEAGGEGEGEGLPLIERFDAAVIDGARQRLGWQWMEDRTGGRTILRFLQCVAFTKYAGAGEYSVGRLSPSRSRSSGAAARSGSSPRGSATPAPSSLPSRPAPPGSLSAPPPLSSTGYEA